MTMQSSRFGALADPTRLRIVEILRDGEQSVNDLAAQVGIHQSGVSRHLKVLGDEGFVRMRPDGQKRLFSLQPDPFREIDAWANEFRALWEARLDRLESALAARRKEG